MLVDPGVNAVTPKGAKAGALPAEYSAVTAERASVALENPASLLGRAEAGLRGAVAGCNVDGPVLMQSGTSNRC